MALLFSAQRLAEDARVQIRRIHQAGVKKGKFEKHSVELDEVGYDHITIELPVNFA